MYCWPAYLLAATIATVVCCMMNTNDFVYNSGCMNIKIPLLDMALSIMSLVCGVHQAFHAQGSEGNSVLILSYLHPFFTM